MAICSSIDSPPWDCEDSIGNETRNRRMHIMAVTCPECEKKFKPKSDVSGKKIKCPFCTEQFVVPAAKPAKPAKAKSEPAAAPPAAAPAEPEKTAEDGLGRDENPYGVKTVELVPRCPNCTEEMGEHDIICLACGYNTLTRAWGKTEKTLGITFGQHLVYLLPAIGTAIFVFFATISLLLFDVVVPYHVGGSAWTDWMDSEAVRMWMTLLFLFWFYLGGLFCFKKFIDQPKPAEIEMDEGPK
jgi:hypothetical protein